MEAAMLADRGKDDALNAPSASQPRTSSDRLALQPEHVDDVA
jgi:hypothetical protein